MRHGVGVCNLERVAIPFCVLEKCFYPLLSFALRPCGVSHRNLYLIVRVEVATVQRDKLYGWRLGSNAYLCVERRGVTSTTGCAMHREVTMTTFAVVGGCVAHFVVVQAPIPTVKRCPCDMFFPSLPSN